MVAISSSSSAVRYSVQQAAVPQVKRAAEKAQQAADALQAQARDAWQQVSSAEANARVVDARANQAISTAAQARQSLVSFGAGILAAEPAAKAEASTTNPNAKAASAAPSTSLPSSPTVQPAPVVINTQGQRIGTLINITA
jgi:hypothetical protein